jgi:deoxyribodipyrimidine photo-lyase
MNEGRVWKKNNYEYQSGAVMYWMNRDMRFYDNWALIYAIEQAKQNHTELVVVYNLIPNYLSGGMRQWDFKLQGLQELAKTFNDAGIHFYIVLDHSGKKTPQALQEIITKNCIGVMITDFCPLRNNQEWVQNLEKKITIPFHQVDAHNIVPVWVVSGKQEYGAYTLRPKIHKIIPEFLDTFPNTKKIIQDVHSQKLKKIINDDYELLDTETESVWKKLKNLGGINPFPEPVDWCTAGERSAQKMLQKFLKEKFTRYDTDRNNPTIDGQSNLSPYLHYGMISAQRVVLEVLDHTNKKDIRSVLHYQKNGSKNGDAISAFLEELIVRRELADNYCFYNPHYDSLQGAPQWAQKTLDEHQNDDREYVYTKKQLEQGKTHDDLWNAAQLQMVATGKMHGYMRMYWAKKILEWTKDPETAIKIAIALNDHYELDGRDPNGYAGIMWSIAGVHDRAWFPRPIFGLVRYMARSGVEKRCDVDVYIQTWLNKNLFS